MTWLIAIGLTNAVLASVLAVLAWGVGRYARRPALSRLMWVLVLCKLLAPPIYQPTLGNWFSTPAWLTRASTSTGSAIGILQQSDASLNSISGRPAARGRSLRATEMPPAAADSPRATARRPSWMTRLTAVSPTSWIRPAAALWLSGSVLCVVWLAYRTWRFRRFLAQVARDDAELTARVARLARDAGLSSAPHALVVESAVSPMLWGAGRGACLLFPAELIKRVDAAACDTLLLHELAHYARGDWLVRVLELAAQVVYWWHPLVWWTLRQIEAAEEECCDAWVVQHRVGERRLYAEALLATLDFLCQPVRALPPAACGLGAAGSLRSRLTQIICGDVALRPSWAAKSLVFVFAAVTLPLGPSIAGSGAREAAALGTPPQAGLFTGSKETRRVSEGQHEMSLAYASGYHNPGQQSSPAEAGQAVVRDETIATSSTPKPWFVDREPTWRAVPAIYATAIAPNGRYQLEARTGHRAALVNVVSKKRLDLSTYRILAASFSPDSRLLASGQDDESAVRLWDAETGEVRALLKGSAAGITSVAFSPDTARVAAGAIDGSVLVWSVSEQDIIARLPRQQSPVSCLRWSTSGDRLAIARSDWSNRDFSSLVVWRPIETGDTKEFPLDHSLGALDWLGEEELVVADWSGAARMIDLASGMSRESFWLGKDQVSAAAFSPDCRLLPRGQARRDEP